MKARLKILFILITLGLLYKCKKPEVPTIPDRNFLMALIEQGVDINGDKSISSEEASSIKILNLGLFDITDLQGIGLFTSLETLTCVMNKISSIDLSNNSSLKYLNCSANLLTSLNISNNSVLEGLVCSQNALTDLDVSNNFELKLLGCDDNLLAILDVSHNPNLEILDCGHNQLTSLNVANNPSLGSLFVNNNLLKSLNIAHNTSIINLNIETMSNLYKVCVWTLPFPPRGVTVYKSNSPNAYFTTDCTN